ncbi:MAG: cation-translocating P-type ATPase [Candidatus Aminicenantes bacterium]|nr:cation-translocating P-type ATPase [Candidatus Aminicenantes bacterium]
MTKWWHLDPETSARQLETDLRSGLSPAAAVDRRVQYGPNQLREQKGRTPLRIFLEQFADFMIWVLIGAALVSGFLKEWVDAAAIVAIVILNAILGFIQEHRAERSLQALRKLAAPFSKVIRDGNKSSIPSADLVPGDIVELEAGDYVPADGRLIQHTANFAVLEASLTGESTPVAKTQAALNEGDVPLADRANMVYLGTSIVSGKGRALIAETGMSTELGRIAGMIQAIVHESTPLQKRLEQFGKLIVYACFGLVALIFGLELLRGGKLLDMFLTSVSLAVAAIPEGLPAVVTIALALGVQRMVKRHALIRKLPAVETLGSASVICSDKTGTLTKNEMTVRAVWTPAGLTRIEGIGYDPTGNFVRDERPVSAGDDPDLRACLEAGVYCNGADLVQKEGRWTIVGDPTEGALLTAAAKAGIRKAEMEARSAFVEEIPFDSERKLMSVIRRAGNEGSLTAYVKGAPDILLDRCTHILENGRPRPIHKDDRARIDHMTDQLSDQALRVLATARRVFEAPPDSWSDSIVERELTFLGLTAMIDPPREEVKSAIAKCRASGIATVMITGDHKNTAIAIARELGFYGEDSRALTGEELDRLDEETFEREVERTAVYARVSPEHKLRVVRAWRKRGRVVAMTGDGVNDAPAVKEADIGVAMGITGTDVTKEVSDMIVTDDNFASIVAAVEEGRGIYDNIKKFIHYLLSCNTGEILTMFVATLIGWPVPLFPIQILWVNLVTDGLPALALGMDPVAPDIMSRSPRRKDEPIITGRRARLIIAQGAFIAACALGAFAFVLFVEHENITRARTAALFALTASQLFHSLNCRSQRDSLFKLGVFTNMILIAAIGASFALQIAILYIPFTQKIFKVEALGLLDLAIVIAVSSFPLGMMELVKLANRRRVTDAKA